VSDLLLMSKRELSRLEVLQQLDERRLTQRAAALRFSLSIRQLRRLLRAYQKAGASALVSRRRGRPSNRRLPEEVRARACALLRSLYPDFGPTLAHEKLSEVHGLSLSLETTRQLMIADGLWQARPLKRSPLHLMRERRSCFGELVQIDGSPHDWFEGRAPRCTLLVFVDDATGRLMQLLFVKAESTFSYFAAVRGYLLAHGLPVAFYSDKLGVFRVNIREARRGTGLTQFGRAMRELGIELIHAHSPQAKGRVERANQTLQDRLTKELRLRSISAIEEANAFLPEYVSDYNRRFAVIPRSSMDAHRPLDPALALERVLCLVEARTLSRQLTFSYKRRLYQVLTKRPPYTLRRARVEVREQSDGTLLVEYKGQPLAHQLVIGQPPPPQATPTKQPDGRMPKAAASRPPRQTPSPTHPWRLSYTKIKPQPRPRPAGHLYLAQNADISTLD
jgi:Homeodomain-like domain